MYNFTFYHIIIRILELSNVSIDDLVIFECCYQHMLFTIFVMYKYENLFIVNEKIEKFKKYHA